LECWIKYEGSFKNNLKDGFGILYLSNEEKFVGFFKNDLINGSGTFHKLDGTKVTGFWSQNKMHA